LSSGLPRTISGHVLAQLYKFLWGQVVFAVIDSPRAYFEFQFVGCDVVDGGHEGGSKLQVVSSKLQVVSGKLKVESCKIYRILMGSIAKRCRGLGRAGVRQANDNFC